MTLFKCKMCGGDLDITPGATVAECEYCGTQQTLPRLDDDRKANLYDRANHFRRNNEFDKAMGIYEQILNEDGTDAEAYWSLVLCRYGIEYVEDPTSHKRLPTVNRAQFTSVFDDDNYKSALQYADSYQKTIYEAEAKAINEIQKDILAISQKEEPFDVFICYKETDNNGRRTPDSVLAQELYYQLTQEGFKVFFSRITLEDKLGSAYEPYIFAALNSAKVMVAMGTKPEYFKAVWVRNEWSRYLALIKSGAKKMLIPAYKDMDPYDLPEEFSHLQAQDMSKLGFMQDLIRGIKKILDANIPKTAVIKETVVAGNANTAPLLKRAFMFLEDGDWSSAEEYCEKVLDIDPECAQAYLGKLMAELRVSKQASLKDEAKPFDDRNNYQKALRFADEKLKKELVSSIEHINTRNENERVEGIYNRALLQMKSAISEDSYKEAASRFSLIGGYRDATALKKECLQKAEVARKDAILADGKAKMAANKVVDYEAAIQLFGSIPGWKDADDQIERCHEGIEKINLDAEIDRKDAIYAKAKVIIMQRVVHIWEYQKAIAEFQKIPGWKDADEQIVLCLQKIDELTAKAEADLVERKRQAKKRARRNKIVAAIVISVVLIAIACIVVLNNVIIPNSKYNNAIALMDAGKYQEAISAFEVLNGYKDSNDKILACNTAILDVKYNEAVALLEAEKYTEAISAFVDLGEHKDATLMVNETRYRQAEAYIRGKQYEDASVLLQILRFTTEYAEKAEQLSAEAINSCCNEGDYERAILIYKRTQGYDENSEFYKNLVYQSGMAAMKDGAYLDAVVAFKKVPGYLDADEQLLEANYQRALEYIQRGVYDNAADILEELNDYKDSQSKILEVKYMYVQDHLSHTDTTTYAYLKELKEAKYKDSAEIFREVYAWKITVTAVNSDENDTKTNFEYMDMYVPVYFHIKLSGGEPGEETQLKAVSTTGDGVTKEYTFSDYWSDGWTGWFKRTTGLSTGVAVQGKLTVKFYDGEGNYIGEGSVIIGQYTDTSVDFIRPTTGKAYKLCMVDTGQGKTLYLNGEMVSYYLAMTETKSQGIDLYLEKSGNGYYMYHLSGGKKVYLNIIQNGTHINAVYESSAKSLWTYNSTLNTMETTCNGTNYFLGSAIGMAYEDLTPCKVDEAENYYIAGFCQ